jgi:predicted small secreted protein
MPEQTVPVIIAIVIGIGAVSVIAYYIAGYLKGSIKLQLPGTAFSPGQPIRGSFIVHTKKDVQCNCLTVTLVGTEVIRRNNHSRRHGSGSSTQSIEIYRDEKLIEENVEFMAGTEKAYEFELTAPGMNATSLPGTQVGQVLNEVFNALGARHSRLSWNINVRLDAKGVDLTAQKTIYINQLSA